MDLYRVAYKWKVQLFMTDDPQKHVSYVANVSVMWQHVVPQYH